MEGLWGGVLEGRGSAWKLSRLPGPEWAEQLPSTPLPHLLEDPSHLFLLNSPQSLPMPPWTNAAGVRGDLEGRVPAWKLSKLPGPEWVGQSSFALLSLFPEGPSHQPLLISPASGAPILPGLHFSSLLCPPTFYQFTWRFLLSP